MLGINLVPFLVEVDSDVTDKEFDSFILTDLPVGVRSIDCARTEVWRSVGTSMRSAIRSMKRCKGRNKVK